MSRQGFYVPSTDTKINPILRNVSKKYVARYYQLKVGHGVVGIFLARIGATEILKCWWCGAHEQTAVHLYIEYRQ